MPKKAVPVVDATNIQIRKSNIPAAGGGVFLGGNAIASGTLLGFYGGVPTIGKSDYRFEGNRDAADPTGRLLMNDGSYDDANAWSLNDWGSRTNAARYGVHWVAGDGKSNWTRFMNHARGDDRNVTMASNSVERFGRAYAFYASKHIHPGDELFFDYGSDYFKARCFAPQSPPPPPEACHKRRRSSQDAHPALFGPGCYSPSSEAPVFTQKQLAIAFSFLSSYRFARNALGYSNRVLSGIKFKGVYVGRGPDNETAAFEEHCVAPLNALVLRTFACDDLEMISLEYSNQALPHKSSWHKDLDDGYPYLNVFVALVDIDDGNGMTTLRLNDEKVVSIRAHANRWYSFDGSITHCAEAAAKPGTPRMLLMATFRRKDDPESFMREFGNYRRVLTKLQRRRGPMVKRERSVISMVTRARAFAK